jgi:translation elongation factor EF-1alpha
VFDYKSYHQYNDSPHVFSAGHVDSGKSTTTGRLLFELGGIPERELEKLKEEAAALGKQSFAFAFYMDRQKEERERGVTISCTTKEFFTEKWHYTIIDAPGHRSAAAAARLVDSQIDSLHCQTTFSCRTPWV